MIRNLTINDYAQAQKLVSEIHKLHLSHRPDIYNEGNSLPYAYFKSIIESSNSLNIAYEEDNHLVGLLIATKKTSRPIPIMKERTTYFIEDLVVTKKYQKKGIGRELYYYLLEKAKEEQCTAIELNVWSFNTSALKFYESLGMSVKNLTLEQVFTSSSIELEKSNLTITNKVEK